MRFKWRYAVLMLCFEACAPKPTQAGLRVGLITPGSISDAAWNSGAYAGLQRIHDSLGLPVRHVESRTPAEHRFYARSIARFKQYRHAINLDDKVFDEDRDAIKSAITTVVMGILQFSTTPA